MPKKRSTLSVLRHLLEEPRSTQTINSDISLAGKQHFTIVDDQLFCQCTAAELKLIGIIVNKLRRFNCLIYIPTEDRTSSSVRQAIKSLKDKKILRRIDEAINFYLVNPYYIRKGTFISCITTTMDMIEKAKGIISIDLIINKKPIKIEKKE